MLLTSVAGIRESLGFDDMTDINAAITTALHAAEPILAATLNTEFARAEVIDTFWVNSPTVRDGSHVNTEFWLSRGFVQGTPVVTGHVSASAAMNYRHEKGIARDWTTIYESNTLVFTYQAGFQADTDNTEAYVNTQVPAWLQEAAKMQALIYLADAAAITEAGIKIDVRVLQQQLQALMTAKIRYAPMALYPL